jgi:Fe-S-cluster containining protein
MHCAKCCNDLFLPILALIFPTAYLDKPGLDFFQAHGLHDLIAKSQDVKFEYQGKVYTINMLGLILPHVYLDEAGQQFYKDQELGALLKKNATVRVIHRCQHLGDDHLCGIYELRPQLCQDYDCSGRDDCTPNNDTHPLEFRK